MTNSNMSVQPYLFFNGRCQEALDFYRSAVGAEVEMLSRFKESILQKPYLDDHPMVRNWAIQAFHGL